MPQIARQYEIYLPICYNDGRDIPETLFFQVEDQLTLRFGGSSMIQQKNLYAASGYFKTNATLMRLLSLPQLILATKEEAIAMHFLSNTRKLLNNALNNWIFSLLLKRLRLSKKENYNVP